MGLFIEDNDLLTDNELIRKRKVIMNKKYDLLRQFRNYVLEYLRRKGKLIEVEYELLNGDPNVCFQDLKVGSWFSYERVYFKFNLKTEITTDYIKESYGFINKLYDKEGDEKIEDVTKGCNIENIKPRISRRVQSNLSMISDFERKKIIETTHLEVDNILRQQVFKRKISFNDPEFERLVKINAYLEREIREIDKRLKPKNNNGNLGQDSKNR